MKKKVLISFTIILFLLIICGIGVGIFFYERDSKIALLKNKVFIELSTYNFKELINIADLSKVKDYSVNFSNVDSSISEETNEISNTSKPNTSSSTTKDNKNKSTSNNVNANTNNTTQIKEEKVEVKEEPQKEPQKEHNQEVPKQQDIVRCTTNNNHGMNVGNVGKWFNSKQEAISYYDNLIKTWGDKWENYEIDSETYYKNCPYGYEVWSCMFCNKWTINFYFR